MALLSIWAAFGGVVGDSSVAGTQQDWGREGVVVVENIRVLQRIPLCELPPEMQPVIGRPGFCVLGLKADSENFVITGLLATWSAFQTDSSRRTGLTLKEGTLALGAELLANGSREGRSWGARRYSCPCDLSGRWQTDLSVCGLFPSRLL